MDGGGQSRTAQGGAGEQSRAEGRVGEVHEEAGDPGIEGAGVERLTGQEVLGSDPIDEEVDVRLRLEGGVEESPHHCHHRPQGDEYLSHPGRAPGR